VSFLLDLIDIYRIQTNVSCSASKRLITRSRNFGRGQVGPKRDSTTINTHIHLIKGYAIGLSYCTSAPTLPRCHCAINRLNQFFNLFKAVVKTKLQKKKARRWRKYGHKYSGAASNESPAPAPVAETESASANSVAGSEALAKAAQASATPTAGSLLDEGLEKDWGDYTEVEEPKSAMEKSGHQRQASSNSKVSKVFSKAKGRKAKTPGDSEKFSEVSTGL
jgi:hypothetical protein